MQAVECHVLILMPNCGDHASADEPATSLQTTKAASYAYTLLTCASAFVASEAPSQVCLTKAGAMPLR